MIQKKDIAQYVKATVVSYYAGRGAEGTDEACVDAGALAFSKDTGPSGTYGEVVSRGHTDWVLGRTSQEHGTLTRRSEGGSSLQVGATLDIVGQHACLSTLR